MVGLCPRLRGRRRRRRGRRNWMEGRLVLVEAVEIFGECERLMAKRAQCV
jgi:hypothetical protein